MLLVLDNAEHLIDEVARLSDAIVTGAPAVRLLVTSQVLLKVERERVFRLGPLAIPEPGTSAHDAMEYGAVGLFVDQAQAADRRFRVTDENVGSVIELVPASRWAGAGDRATAAGTDCRYSACAGCSSGWAIGSSCL